MIDFGTMELWFATGSQHLYGDQTRTILSQAYTKWIFATSDPESADILEKIGGKRKLLRLEQTHSHGTTIYDRTTVLSGRRSPLYGHG